LYDRLFKLANPESEDNFIDALNPDSLEILTDARVESSLATAQSGNTFQFERTGYFCVDSVESTPESLVFNRTVTLRDTWGK
jgi:glutaminyl-tRNA synthetase